MAAVGIWIAFSFGIVLIIATAISVVGTLVVPRGSTRASPGSPIAASTWRSS